MLMRCCYHLLPGLAGVRVSKVKPGSPTSRAKNLMIGDVLLEINDVVLFLVDKGIRKWFEHADVIGVRTSLPTYLSLPLSLSLLVPAIGLFRKALPFTRLGRCVVRGLDSFGWYDSHTCSSFWVLCCTTTLQVLKQAGSSLKMIVAQAEDLENIPPPLARAHSASERQACVFEGSVQLKF